MTNLCDSLLTSPVEMRTLVEQRRLDLLLLLVAQETLEADEDHHVIADVAARQQMLGE